MATTRVHSVAAIRKMIPIVELEDDDTPPPPAASSTRAQRVIRNITSVLCSKALLVVVSAFCLFAALFTTAIAVHESSSRARAQSASLLSPSTLVSPSAFASRNSTVAPVETQGNSTTNLTDPELLAQAEYPLNLFRDVAEFPIESSDVPFIWIVPRGGATSLYDIMHQCYQLKSVRNLGFDTTTKEGLEELKQNKVLAAGNVDFFESGFLYESAQIFDANHRGRLIASFRHPNDRVLSLFLHWQDMGDPRVDGMTFLDYLHSDLFVGNWVTRYLTNKKSHWDGGELTDHDLKIAKRNARRKCLVLLAEYPDESLSHLQKYYGWVDLKASLNCTSQMLEDNIREEVDRLDPQSEESKLLDSLNKYDLLLHQYLKELFVVQGYELDMDPKFGAPGPKE